MAGRYWITGVQLALLKDFADIDKRIPDRNRTNKMLKEISDKQYIGSYPTDADKKRFNKWIKKAPA